MNKNLSSNYGRLDDNTEKPSVLILANNDLDSVSAAAIVAATERHNFNNCAVYVHNGKSSFATTSLLENHLTKDLKAVYILGRNVDEMVVQQLLDIVDYCKVVYIDNSYENNKMEKLIPSDKKRMLFFSHGNSYWEDIQKNDPEKVTVKVWKYLKRVANWDNIEKIWEKNIADKIESKDEAANGLQIIPPEESITERRQIITDFVEKIKNIRSYGESDECYKVENLTAFFNVSGARVAYGYFYRLFLSPEYSTYKDAESGDLYVTEDNTAEEFRICLELAGKIYNGNLIGYADNIVKNTTDENVYSFEMPLTDDQGNHKYLHLRIIDRNLYTKCSIDDIAAMTAMMMARRDQNDGIPWFDYLLFITNRNINIRAMNDTGMFDALYVAKLIDKKTGGGNRFSSGCVLCNKDEVLEECINSVCQKIKDNIA